MTFSMTQDSSGAFCAEGDDSNEMDVRKIWLLVVLLAFSLALAGCKSFTPITIEQVPVYPDAVLVEPGNVMAETIAGAIRENADTEAVDVEIRMYTLPPETPWEAVLAYYQTEIDTEQWQQTEDLKNESDYVNTVGWTRGGLSGEQAFLVGHSIDPLGGAPFLILMLFTN